MRVFRLFKIFYTIQRYGLLQIFQEYKNNNFLSFLIACSFFFIPIKYKEKNLPERTKLAFEELGPVFIKFGQMLSTRQDLIAPEFILQLSQLQNQVKPFSSTLSKKIIEKSLGQKIENVFTEFSQNPIASASIAQVHKAKLIINSHEVAIKVKRPNIENIIANDIKLLNTIAIVIEKLFNDGKRLKPREVIKEFDKIINNELDFLQEASNAERLANIHKNDPIILIPKIYHQYSSSNVIILEWMNGTKISDLTILKQKQIDLVKLSYNGVAIFYTQVFNYGFFHADMHPGNILCDDTGRYIALDFGIIGSLSDKDKRYLAINILAFFNRDYKKIAIAHVESGWAPHNTSITELEIAIRTVCEPIFNKPLKDISFGQVLIKLFQVSRKFDIEVQPQLILLQKTIVNIEGLGRMLNPNLDLWVSAKPFLEKWVKEQMGLKTFIKNIKSEMMYWSYLLPKIPKNIANIDNNLIIIQEQNMQFIKQFNRYKRQNQLLILFISILILIVILLLKK